jgi:hypothetical protein
MPSPWIATPAKWPARDDSQRAIGLIASQAARFVSERYTQAMKSARKIRFSADDEAWPAPILRCVLR